ARDVDGSSPQVSGDIQTHRIRWVWIDRVCSSYTRPPENAMSRLVTVAATQMSCSWDRQANIARAEKLVRQAAAQGAQIILIQELFETPYFCQKPNPEYLQMATPTDENPAI